MGHSGDSDAPYTIPYLADDAAGLMGALGYESMHVYGVSMGSSISRHLVIDHPEMVGKLVLSSSTYSVGLNETKTLHDSLVTCAGDTSQGRSRGRGSCGSGASRMSGRPTHRRRTAGQF
jgi:pimeloyl-ACP methyl ester carboxylesterase